MNKIKQYYNNISASVDLPFLLFLLTISSNKIYLKVLAVALIFALKPRFSISKLKTLPLFYPLIICLAIVQLAFPPYDFIVGRMAMFAVGILYWTLCYLYLYQTVQFVEDRIKAITTVKYFLVINAFACAVNYTWVAIQDHSLLPFLSYDERFGASTGDYITGLFGRPSYINAVVSYVFGFFFLFSKQYKWYLLCVFIALLSFANIINILFAVTLLLNMVLVRKWTEIKWMLLSLVLCFVMYRFVSPDNYRYLAKTVGLSVSDEREIMPKVVAAGKGTKTNGLKHSVKYLNDSSAASQTILMLDRNEVLKGNYEGYKTYDSVDITKSPGKKIAVKQTIGLFKDHPSTALVGAGMGRFSSRLAFQFSGRDSSRLFMRLPKYASGYYYSNNLLIYDSMRQLPNEYHSIKHFPNNFFSQLLGEYGLLGLFLFLGTYLWYFYKRTGNRSFFVVIVVFVGGLLMLDYFFEYFNVVVVIEMILLLTAQQQLTENGAKSE